MYVQLAIAAASMLAQSSAAQQSARAARKAAEAEYRARKAQAKLVMQRALINQSRMRADKRIMQQNQTAAYAASGVLVTSGAVLQTLNDTQNKSEQQIDDMMTDAKHQSAVIMKGGQVALQSGVNAARAAQAQGTASMLSTAAQAAPYAQQAYQQWNAGS